MTRRARGKSRDGLFRWLASGEVAVGEVTANPLLVDCPACGATRLQACRKPSRRSGGHVDVDPHPSRIERAGAAVDQPNAPALPSRLPAQPRTEPPR